MNLRSDRHRPWQGIVMIFIAAMLALALLPGHIEAVQHRVPDPLPSWNEGPVKEALIAFIAEAARSVPPQDRIAAFDLDGTLMVEKPLYIQTAFMAESIKAQAKQHPEWTETNPFKALLGNDLDYLGHITTSDVGKLLEVSFPGLSVKEYQEKVREWLASYSHPRFGFCYGMLVYRPMVELIASLQRAGFKTYICSGTTSEFIRVFSMNFFGIPPEMIIGSRMAFDCRETAGAPEIVKKPQVITFNDRGEKVINLEHHIGKRPIIAVGNSNGDIEMLGCVDPGKGPSLRMVVHHDDGVREYSYDWGADRVLSMAEKKKWTVISMKKDFRTIFITEELQKAR